MFIVKFPQSELQSFADSCVPSPSALLHTGLLTLYISFYHIQIWNVLCYTPVTPVYFSTFRKKKKKHV